MCFGRQQPRTANTTEDKSECENGMEQRYLVCNEFTHVTDCLMSKRTSLSAENQSSVFCSEGIGFLKETFFSDHRGLLMRTNTSTIYSECVFGLAENFYSLTKLQNHHSSNIVLSQCRNNPVFHQVFCPLHVRSCCQAHIIPPLSLLLFTYSWR